MNGADHALITQVLYRYGAAIDQRDWTALRSVVTDDLLADYGALGVWRSGDAFVAAMDEAHRKYGATQHRITNVLIDIQGAQARCGSYLDALLWRNDRAVRNHVVGRYDDVLRAAPQGWRLARRALTVISWREESSEGLR